MPTCSAAGTRFKHSRPSTGCCRRSAPEDPGRFGYAAAEKLTGGVHGKQEHGPRERGAREHPVGSAGGAQLRAASVLRRPRSHQTRGCRSAAQAGRRGLRRLLGDLAAQELTWQTPFKVTLDESDAPNYRWFSDGELNASFNCLDVHLNERGDKTAVIFEGEPGDVRRLSYRELHAEVCRFANVLKAQGVGRGDRVIIYMPLVPEIVIAMHACNRIGAIHSVVFGGFSAPALRDRIEDTEARLVITADGGWRGGQAIELKAAADKALSAGCPSVQGVIVLRRTGKPIAMQTGRDIWWHEAIEGHPPSCEPEWVDAEHPLFVLYTSGSTGKPKGVQHATGG